MSWVLSDAEQELLKLARQLGPEVVHGLADLLKKALGGTPDDELKKQGEKLAILTAYKAGYHRGG